MSCSKCDAGFKYVGPPLDTVLVCPECGIYIKTPLTRVGKMDLTQRMLAAQVDAERVKYDRLMKLYPTFRYPWTQPCSIYRTPAGKLKVAIAGRTLTVDLLSEAIVTACMLDDPKAALAKILA